MHAYFAVLKTSHYAVTGDNGAFSLNNLPPGKYTITAWHETLGTQTQEVTITGNETAPVNFVFKQLETNPRREWKTRFSIPILSELTVNIFYCTVILIPRFSFTLRFKSSPI